MWRKACLIIIVLVAAWCVYWTYFASRAYGDWGVTSRRLGLSSDTRVFVAVSVEPGSPAAEAGIVAGDQLRALVQHQIQGLSASPGRRVQFEVTHGSSRRIVTLVSATRFVPRHPTEPILFVYEITILGLAFLLTWRRWNDRDARPLILYFTCSAGAAVPAIPTILFPLLDLVNFIAIAGLVRFACIYPSNAPTPRVRRAFAVIAPALAVALGIVYSARSLSVAWLNISFIPLIWQRYAAIALRDISPVIGLLAGFVGATSEDRKRLALLLGFLVLGESGLVAFSILLSSPTFPALDARPLRATAMITALGFVYMIFHHRMFDVSFVLNRAAVYAAISTLLVPLLLVGEWLAQRVLAGENQTENALVQVGIALLLFVVARLLYDRIDRVVDHLLFRERHENEDALRSFPRRVTLLDDAQAIGEQTVQVVCSHTDAAWVALYRRDATGDYVLSSRKGEPELPALVGRNDPAVLALRADRTAVENLRESAFTDALVLPAIGARGLGEFLVCGPKRNGETYAPDERDALLQLAHGIAVAFDAVHISQIESENARLRATLQPAT